MHRRIGALCWMLGASACITTTTVNIGQKTSLERQLMGELEPLTDEEVLALSVRAGPDSAGMTPLDPVQQRALAARRRQLFNRDDLDELRRHGCVGEARLGQVVARDCASGTPPPVARRRDALVVEENDDRQAVVEWVVAADPTLTPADKAQLHRVLHLVVAGQLPAGAWLENDSGAWVRK